MSASVITQANLYGAYLTNTMVDRVNLTGVDMSDAVLVEALLLRTKFVDINIESADFTDAILDGVEIEELCQKARDINCKNAVKTLYFLGCK